MIIFFSIQHPFSLLNEINPQIKNDKFFIFVHKVYDIICFILAFY